MTEQQANALMEYIQHLSKTPTQLSIDALAALTALCRHRDEILYSRILWYLPLEEVKRFHDMQTWGEV